MSRFDKMTFGLSCQGRKSRCLFGHYPTFGVLFLVASLLPACSGMKTYDNSLAKNLNVRSETDSGSWLSSVRAAVDIHRVEKDCTTAYEGTVQLREAAMSIGIPPDRWSYLVFVFASSSFLGNRSGTITYETLLKPQPNHHYDVTVNYRGDMYHVVIREIPPNRSTGRDIDPLPLSSCRTQSAQK